VEREWPRMGTGTERAHRGEIGAPFEKSEEAAARARRHIVKESAAGGRPTEIRDAAICALRNALYHCASQSLERVGGAGMVIRVRWQIELGIQRV